MCQRRILYDGICVYGIFEKNKTKEEKMKQTIYNIKTRQCKTNYSPDPWGELKAINDRAIIDNMIRDYTQLNIKQGVTREQLRG